MLHKLLKWKKNIIMKIFLQANVRLNLLHQAAIRTEKPPEHSRLLLPTGTLVLYGQKTQPAFYLVDLHLTLIGKIIRTICRKPEHVTEMKFLPVIINETQYLCVSCTYCKTICLVNLNTLQVTTACTEIDVRKWCQGDANTHFTFVPNCTISVLDISTTNFIIKGNKTS